MLVNLQSFDVDVRQDVGDRGAYHERTDKGLGCQVAAEGVRGDDKGPGASERGEGHN